MDEFERLAQRSAAAHEPPAPSPALASVATAFGASPASALEGSFRFDPPAAVAAREGAGSSGTAPSTPVSKLPDASASRWTQGDAAAAGVPVVHRPVRPSEAEMR